jgi:hypothetical protein
LTVTVDQLVVQHSDWAFQYLLVFCCLSFFGSTYDALHDIEDVRVPIPENREKYGALIPVYADMVRGQTSGSTSYTWAISLANVEWLSRSETESAASASWGAPLDPPVAEA